MKMSEKHVMCSTKPCNQTKLSVNTVCTKLKLNIFVLFGKIYFLPFFIKYVYTVFTRMSAQGYFSHTVMYLCFWPM